MRKTISGSLQNFKLRNKTPYELQKRHNIINANKYMVDIHSFIKIMNTSHIQSFLFTDASHLWLVTNMGSAILSKSKPYIWSWFIFTTH